ncbi:MAG: hypothetical protein HY738_07535 [Bacteroidia bacterium]|nr:hypothetical protein [Bacteroidia bacterium]
MENNFICPKCNGYLNVADHIVFSTKAKNGSHGLIFLSPKVGDYTVEKHISYNYSPGEQLFFYCPLCRADLTAPEVNKNLAKVFMIDSNNKKHAILFSMIAGEKCTYKLSEDEVESFGDSANVYLNFINLSMHR